MTDGFDRVLDRLNWRTLFAQYASYLSREMAEMFESAGASRGHAWQELAESTLRAKLRAGRSSEILQLSGVLRGSFRALRLTEDGLEFGTDVAYARAHDRGTRRLPRRPLLVVLDRDREALAALIRETIAGDATRAGHVIERNRGPSPP